MSKKGNRRMVRQLPTLSEQIRQLIDECGVSRYRIAKDTGVSEPALSHFMTGKTGLSMRALDELGTYLGLVVTIDERRRPNQVEI
jgi:predicted transcriptional regulator